MPELPAVGVSMEELQLAARNHGMPLEALRYPVTPVGLHYLLVHYDIPVVEEQSWTLCVNGAVGRELELSMAELRAMPATTRVVTMECAGNGRALLQPRPASQPWLLEAVGTGAWTGVELRHVLEAAQLGDPAVELVFTGIDRGLEGGQEQPYQRSVPVEEALSSGALLAYDLNGTPLPPQHGFPLRLVVPGWYGMTNVKWLASIEAVTEPFEGYQHTRAYRLWQSDDDPGEPVERMLPRSLMVPPGIPDFFTRRRAVSTGACTLEGRAWSGRGAIVSVDVSTDGGATWQRAVLDDERPSVPGTWTGWTCTWQAARGDYELMCRATDDMGATQPLEPEWNRGGYVNNSVQRVSVTVV
jgi:DMSO/TMAO reductase YedYZ molybdopterin-dependent catalytic subunit